MANRQTTSWPLVVLMAAAVVAVIGLVRWLFTRPAPSRYELDVRSRLQKVIAPEGVKFAPAFTADLTPEAAPADQPKPGKKPPRAAPPRPTRAGPTAASGIVLRRPDGEETPVEVLSPEQAKERLRELRRRLSPGAGDRGPL